MHPISLNSIYARSLNNVIGLGNQLPWKIPGDLSRFKRLTEGGLAIMGRKTWDSLPKKPLAGRINVVLSSGPATHEDANTYFAGSPARVLEIIRQHKEKQAWLIGGVSVYQEFAGLVETVYETVVMSNEVVGDTYYKFDRRTRLLREDERMSCQVDGKTVDVVNRVLQVVRR
jgi:dihydrofolate reductase